MVGDFSIGNKKVMNEKGKAKYCGATIKKYIYFKMLQKVRRLRDRLCSQGNGRFLRNDSGVRFWFRCAETAFLILFQTSASSLIVPAC